MPHSIALAIVSWWLNLDSYRNQGEERKFSNALMYMPSPRYVDIKELDSCGHAKPVGWTLPVAVVEATAKELS
jgi:hypothetical protein